MVGMLGEFMMPLMNINSIGFSVPTISGLAARKVAMAPNASKEKNFGCDDKTAIDRDPIYDFGFFTPIGVMLAIAQALKLPKMTNPSSSPPRSFCAMPNEANNQKT